VLKCDIYQSLKNIANRAQTGTWAVMEMAALPVWL